EAVATSLFTIFLVVSNNCWGFHKRDLVIWRISLIIGPMTAIGAYASGILSQSFSDQTLRMVLAGLVSVFLLRALVGKKLKDKAAGVGEVTEPLNAKTGLVSGFIGVIAGLLSGISGIGAGLVVSPLLINLNLAENERVSPTANGVMIFTTFFGALAYGMTDSSVDGWKLGYIHLDKALLLFGSAFVTSHFARRRQSDMPVRWRKGLLTALLALLTLKMWIEVIF
ncbi:MAG: sulfite exporter TauE/SafE family protein, partial [Pseudomonadota bacterium]